MVNFITIILLYLGFPILSRKNKFMEQWNNSQKSFNHFIKYYLSNLVID